MKNVSLDRTTVLQLYTHRTDGALNAAADCDILGNHAAIDRGAIGWLLDSRSDMPFVRLFLCDIVEPQ